MASCCTSDCPVQYGYCPQNKSTAQITDFQLQLDELKIVFYLVLERYRESYPLYIAQITNNENTDLYNESKSQLDSTFNDLFILESSIESALNGLDMGIKIQDDVLLALKDRYNKDTSELDVLRNTNLASYPMKREFEQYRFNGYIDLGYYIVASLVVVFLLFKGIIGNSKIMKVFVSGKWVNIKVPAKGKLPPPIVSAKVAKISTMSAAVIAEILSIYYG